MRLFIAGSEAYRIPTGTANETAVPECLHIPRRSKDEKD